MDSCCSCAITPKMLQSFFQNKADSLYECMLYFNTLLCMKLQISFSLAAMAYDRYVAICKPLQYTLWCQRNSAFRLPQGPTWLKPAFSIHIGFLFRLTFCRSHQINHFFVMFLYRLSTLYSYVPMNWWCLSFRVSSSVLCYLFVSLIFSSFLHFLNEIHERKIKPYLLMHTSFSVSIFYSSLLFMYIRPNSVIKDKDISCYFLY